MPAPATVPASLDPVPEGSRMVYLCPSASNPTRSHRVDLLGMGGAGECSCKDWATRRGPAIKAGMPPGTRATLCRHVLAVRRHFLNGLLAEMSRQESNPPSSHP